MSDTPQTDAEAFWKEVEVVEADFARKLERENAALRADNAATHALVLDLRAKEHTERTLAVHLENQNAKLRKERQELREIDEAEAAIAADTIRSLKAENAALREKNENLASLLFRVLRKLDKNDPLRIHCLDYLKKIGRTLNPFRDAIDAARKEAQP